MKTIGKFSLENRGAYLCKIKLKKYDGDKTREITASDKPFPELAWIPIAIPIIIPIPIGKNTKIVDPGDFGVPDGAVITMYAYIVGGSKTPKQESDPFIYKKGSVNMGKFRIAGTLFFNNTLEWLNESDFIDESLMKVYQVVEKDNSEVKEGCIKLLRYEVEKSFPKSKDIVAGFYVEHPKNKASLVPLKNYYNYLGDDQHNECMRLLWKMGAKYVRIKTIDKNTKHFSISGDINVMEKAKIGGGYGSHGDSFNSTEREGEFEGNKTKFDRSLLDDLIWLKYNPEIRFIFDAREESPDNENKLITYKFSTEVSEDNSYDVKFAAKILDAVEANLELEAKQATGKILEYEFRFE